MLKIKSIQNMLENRIRQGDYLLRDFPSERELSEEVGASRGTTRKAIERLMQKGLLERQFHGRLTIKKESTGNLATFAFLVPSVASGNVEKWRLAIETVVQNINATVRTILYVHWDDPVLLDAIENFDHVFVFPNGEEIPKRVLKLISGAGRSVAFLERDMTMHHIQSVCLFPGFFTERLLDVLGNLGHRNVDCFNIQTLDPVILGRIEQWQLWCASHEITGNLYNEPIEPYTPYETQLEWAYNHISKVLSEGGLKTTSLFCTTVIAALGAMRALRERCIKIGEDVSICTINDEGLARYLSPSLTCIEMPDPNAFISACVERMQSTNSKFVSLLIQPNNPHIYIGESTNPPVKRE